VRATYPAISSTKPHSATAVMGSVRVTPARIRPRPVRLPTRRVRDPVFRGAQRAAL
jgi:hypothetical protein